MITRVSCYSSFIWFHYAQNMTDWLSLSLKCQRYSDFILSYCCHVSGFMKQASVCVNILTQVRNAMLKMPKHDVWDDNHHSQAVVQYQTTRREAVKLAHKVDDKPSFIISWIRMTKVSILHIFKLNINAFYHISKWSKTMSVTVTTILHLGWVVHIHQHRNLCLVHYIIAKDKAFRTFHIQLIILCSLQILYKKRCLRFKTNYASLLYR